MKTKQYADDGIILNRVEWARGNRLFRSYLIIFLCVVVGGVCFYLHTKKVRHDKEIAFKSGYAKALQMDKLPEDINLVW